MRYIHPDVITALESRLFTPIFFVEIMFDEPLRFTSAYSSMTIGGKEYFGAGNLGSVSKVSEGVDLNPQEFKIVVAGVNEASLAAVITQNYLNREASCFVALIDEQGEIIGGPDDGPMHSFSGNVDEIPCEIGKRGKITIVVRDELADWARPKVERYTNADQQARYPGDIALEYMSQVADRETIWPASSYFD
ncbi:hypothetical protein [Marinobacter sp. BGYM27]|uniref:hypothetical protein n=1 Tax=Marinobacter sp. BGYM27 TaxID=2975597 RepID=UPI0021A93024|nr:hypothetical protein [Marinobacter sp. BGYM27]MDG5498975.1 hypothetical protein [Marinobacter sp. BGYM27]